MKNIKLIIALFLFTQVSFAQERKVHGIVKDNLGLFVPGVNVAIKADKKYLRVVQTDFDGKYEILAKVNDTLFFNFVGMMEKKVTASETEINVTLYEQKLEYDCVYYDIFPEKQRLIVNRPINVYKKNNPKVDFKKGAKQNYFVIFLFNTNKICKIDNAFEKKFNIKYTIASYSNNEKYANLYNQNEEYVKAYNKLVFKHLNRKFKKAWQAEIRKEAVGLEDFLN